MRSLRNEARADAFAEAIRSVFRARGIAMSVDLAKEMATWSGVSQEALVSAAMSCVDEADFRARVWRGQAPDDDGRDPG